MFPKLEITIYNKLSMEKNNGKICTFLVQSFCNILIFLIRNQFAKRLSSCRIKVINVKKLQAMEINGNNQTAMEYQCSSKV